MNNQFARTLTSAFLGSAILLGSSAVRTHQSPDAIAADLIAADKAFAETGAKTDLVSALADMFRDDVVMMIPGTTFATGREAAVAALRGNPLNATSKAEWSPVRAGISSDGLHGFTFGYFTARRADGTVVPAKYVTYWIKGQDGWRAAAYKRVPGTETSQAPITMPPLLPAQLVPPSHEPAALEAHRASLVAAERAFSDDAQVIGLGAAFTKHGSPDSVNIAAGRPGFVVTSEAIGQGISATRPGTGSPVTWGTTVAIVASSGDLGVSMGTSFTNGPDGKPAPTPAQTFFTVWRRASPTAPWRHVVE